MNQVIVDTFNQKLVTTSITLKDGKLDLKAAALFYDQLVILDHPLFGVSVENLIGQDIKFLREAGFIDIQPIRSMSSYNLNPVMEPLLEATSSKMLESLFAPDDKRRPYVQIGANGLARLEAAQLAQDNPGIHFVPYVHGKTPLSISAKPPVLGAERIAFATELLFKHIPVPTLDTRWSDIIEFRNRDETRFFATRMQRWLRNATSEANNSYFVRDLELDLHSLEEELRDAKIGLRVARFRMLVVALDAFHEGLKMLIGKLGAAAKPPLDITEQLTKISDIEKKLEKEPLYLIADVRSRFGKGQT